MKILLVSDSPVLASGQARVVRELAQGFTSTGDEVEAAGWFHVPSRPSPIPTYPVSKMNPETLAPVLATKRDVVIAIGDPHDFRWLAAHRANGGKYLLVGYLNIESRPLVPELEVVLDAFDVLVTTSEFGRDVIGRPYVHAIHHGVDRSTFFRQRKPKEEDEQFVVFVNAQNIERKNLPAALMGFARFAETRNDVRLFINTKVTPSPNDAPGHDLRPLFVSLGITDKISVARGNNGPMQTVSDEDVNEMYAMADVLLVTSMSEGFCLPVLEAMATWTMPIAPDAYSMTELIGTDRGLLYPAAAKIIGNRKAEMVIVSDADVAAALDLAYEMWRDHEPLERMRRNGAMFAMARPWSRTLRDLYEAIAEVRFPRAANGLPIREPARRQARAVVRKHDNLIGILKLGGLGDMLQTTVVVEEACRKYERQAVVFVNDYEEVFKALPEVVEVVKVDPVDQAQLVRSVADEFSLFFDVRYVSMMYGTEPTDFTKKHRWFYDGYGASSSRLADLKMHSTSIMLRSFDLTGDIRPRYRVREGGPGAEGPYLAVASGVGGYGKLKQWPRVLWEEFADQMDSKGHTLVQVGGEKDMPIPGTIDCRGGSLARTAAILEHSLGLVAVEGGMVHLAAAAGVKSVVIFGPTPTEVFGYPWNLNLRSSFCPPCWWNMPTWINGHCIRVEPACVNFPDVEMVVKSSTALAIFSQQFPRNLEADVTP